MTTIQKALKRYALTGLLVLSLTNCQTSHETISSPLVTEREECFLKNYIHITEEALPVTISIDLPVEGPQPLMDSLTVFLNKTLYEFFDNDGEQHLPYDSVFSKDVRKLAEHYQKAYKPFYPADSIADHEFNSDCLEVKLVAQTNSYITYEVDRIFYGEGVETATDWVTFVKSDGHRLTEVISNDNMMRFYKEHPEQRNNDIWESVQFHLSEHGEAELVSSIGLLNDSVAHQYAYTAGIFEDVKYPLETIAPYLSKEAAELTGMVKEPTE